MYTIIGIILGFVISLFLLISYLEYKQTQHSIKQFNEDFSKFKTRTGALSNDRINERTTIPKRNAKK
jgi:uncharacterized membrane protein (DUF106 family)